MINIRPYIKSIYKRLFPVKYEIRMFDREKQLMENRIHCFRNIDESEYPDALKKRYYASTGHTLNLDDPKRYTEKIQWRKLYDRDPIYSRLADKYAVREWVEEKIGNEYLIPLLGVWDRFEDIDFKKLPDSFVLKTNNANATNYIVKDKRKLNRRLAKHKFGFWLKFPFYLNGLQLHYKNIKPRIIAEKYMEEIDNSNGIVEYKFFCFHGKPQLCGAMSYSETHHAQMDYFDMDWNDLKIRRTDTSFSKVPIRRPDKFDDLKKIASILSAGFAHVRVDLYLLDNKIYFGEMTFTPTNGFIVHDPDEADYEIGKLWDINAKQVDLDKINETYREKR